MESEEPLPERKLTKGQGFALGSLVLVMAIVGGVGAFGTFSNASRVFPDDAGTALGVVAGGEGTTLILALTQIALTLLGQSTPWPVRLGLWVLPSAAAVTGVVMATSLMEAVVYGVTPMAMCVAAEGLGLVARRIVIYRTRVDMEAQRRTADVTRAVAFTRAVAANHPDEKARDKALRRSWKLAAKVGVGDEQLGVGLVGVQRYRLTEGADAALEQMLTVSPDGGTPYAVTGVTEREGRHDGSATAVTDPGHSRVALTSGEKRVTEPGTQVSGQIGSRPSRAGVSGETAVTPSTVTEQASSDLEVEAQVSRGTESVTLAELAAVEGVSVPVPGVTLTDAQMAVVLRHLRYREDPPLSYRQAQTAYRTAKFKGSEERVRKVFSEVLAAEGTSSPPAAENREDETEEDEAEEPERRS